MRLLYVGLTRARDALWVGRGVRTAQTRRWRRCWAECARRTGRALVGDVLACSRARAPSRSPTPPPAAGAQGRPAARAHGATRRARATGGSYSFSQLHRQSGRRMRRTRGRRAPTNDEPRRPALADGDRAFSRQSASATPCTTRWNTSTSRLARLADDRRRGPNSAAAGQALHQPGLRDADDIDDGVRALAPLIGDTLNAPLPEGARLCDLPPAARAAEIEFHFALAEPQRRRCWRCCTRTASSATAATLALADVCRD